MYLLQDGRQTTQGHLWSLPAGQLASLPDLLKQVCTASIESQTMRCTRSQTIHVDHGGPRLSQQIPLIDAAEFNRWCASRSGKIVGSSQSATEICAICDEVRLASIERLQETSKLRKKQKQNLSERENHLRLIAFCSDM